MHDACKRNAAATKDSRNIRTKLDCRNPDSKSINGRVRLFGQRDVSIQNRFEITRPPPPIPITRERVPTVFVLVARLDGMANVADTTCPSKSRRK